MSTAGDNETAMEPSSQETAAAAAAAAAITPTKGSKGSRLRIEAPPFKPTTPFQTPIRQVEGSGTSKLESMPWDSINRRVNQPTISTSARKKLSRHRMYGGSFEEQARALEKLQALGEGIADANQGIATANQGIDNIEKKLLDQAAEAHRRAEEAEKRRSELETELAVARVTMQHKVEMAKKQKESQGELLAALNVQLANKEAALDHQRQIIAVHQEETNSYLGSFQHQLDEMNTKNDNNAADMMEQLETLQFDLADLEKHVTAKSDEEKERYELERMRLEKRLDGLSATLRLLGQPGKMIQQVDELKAASKEEHSLRLQAESEIADLEQKVKVLSARIRNLDATTSSNGRKSMPAIKDEAKKLLAPTDHVDIGDAKEPATSSTRPILGNRDANTDADADATTDAGSVRDLVKGASKDIGRRATAREEREVASRTQGLLPPVQTMPRRTTRSTPCKPPRTPARKATTEGKTPLRRSARKRS